jgi:endonuclease YncB( thermonuclease family)
LYTSRLTTLTLMLLVAVSASCSRTHRTQASKYRVIHIADGDTITVLDADTKEVRVRLQGIDAPEKGQAFGTESRRHLSELLLGKEVTLQGDKTDKYGRVLCKVIIDDRDANLEQINAGFAWLYRQYEKDLSNEDKSSYSNAESEAHSAKRGLWSAPAPTPPWEYRHPGDRPSSSIR